MTTRTRRLAPAWRLAAPLALFWILAMALQWRGLSFVAEFGSHHDEPAHYVTGLMVRDYIAAGMPSSPLPYAEEYYLHYPKVAFGHWPPVFYVVQAAWTLPFGASRASLLALMALLTALLATLVYAAVRREHGAVAGLAAGVLFLSLPLVQEFARVLMSEMLQALLFFAAALALARYVDRPQAKWSAAFGILAALAILNKGTGIALAALPPTALILTFRFGLLARLSMWLPALLVVLIAAPWYMFAPSAMHETSVPLNYVVASPEWTPRIRLDWIPLVGTGLLPLAVLGLIVKVIVPFVRTRRVEGIWATATGLVIGVLGFRAWTPVAIDPRHVLPMVPAFLLFVVGGTAWLIARLPGTSGPRIGWKAPLVGAVLAVVVVANVAGMPPKERRGFSSVAGDLVSSAPLRDSVFLVSSSALGEGMFIAEMAMREKRPGHIVLRASKVLSTSGWMGDAYRSHYDTTAELDEYLEGIPVGILVIDYDFSEPQAHHALLKELVAERPDRWKPAGMYPPGAAPGQGIRVYRLEGHEDRPVRRDRIDIPHGRRVRDGDPGEPPGPKSGA